MKTGRFRVILPLAICALLSGFPGTSTAYPLDGGAELQVNVQTQGMQRRPSVASDGRDLLMVVWSSDYHDPSTPVAIPGIFGRVYRTSGLPFNTGLPQTPEVRIAGSVTEPPTAPRVASDTPGRFFVVWEQQGKIIGRRFDRLGRPFGGEIRLDTSAGTAGSPSLAARPGGGFVVVWKETRGIRGLLLDVEVDPVAPELAISSGSHTPEVAVSPSGAFVVTWSTAGAGVSQREILARRFDPEGHPQDEAFAVNTIAAYDLGSQVTPVPLFHANGDFSIVWQTPSPDVPGVFARRYTEAGQPAEQIQELDRRAVPRGVSPPAIAVEPAGQILVLWNGAAPQDDDGLYGRLFSPSWEPLGESFLVNTHRPQSQTEPAVVANRPGGFMAVWGSGGEYPPALPQHGDNSQDGFYFGVFIRFLAAAGCSGDDTRLCLQQGRFQVQVSWTDHDGNFGEGRPFEITDDTGAFFFFSPINLELMVKVLDGRAINGKFWVFYGALSDVSYAITVTDTATGATRTYTNPPGQLASQADTDAFPDLRPPAGAASRAKVSAAASILPGSPEFQVNVGTAGTQIFPALASDDAGNVMVVWTSPHEGLQGLYGRIYDPQGNPRTGEFLVAHPTGPSLSTAVVAANRAGEFLVAWDEGGGILARRFGGNGTPLGGPVRLNPAGSNASAPSIASGPQGGFVLVWVDQTGIRGLLLDAQANPAGPAFEVAAASIILGAFQRDPSVSVSSAGNFVVTWAAENSLFRDNIWARSFDADGRPQGNEILVNGVAPYQAGFQHGAVPLAFPDGSFLVVWQTTQMSTGGRPGVFSRYFGAGQPPAGILELNPPETSPFFSSPALAMDRLGRIVLLWNGSGPGDDEDGLFARFLGPTGEPEGDTFLMNVFREQSQTEPAVVASGAGGFVAVWASGTDYPMITPVFDPGPFSQDGSYFGIFGRRFDQVCPADGVTLCLGDRFRVQVSWTDHDGNTGVGHPVHLALDTGAFWFFESDNLELMIKVLDGRAVNGHFWVFYGALSDVRYTITVTDTTTGATRTYTNPPGRLASRADTEAFPRE